MQVECSLPGGGAVSVQCSPTATGAAVMNTLAATLNASAWPKHHALAAQIASYVIHFPRAQVSESSSLVSSKEAAA